MPTTMTDGRRKDLKDPKDPFASTHAGLWLDKFRHGHKNEDVSALIAKTLEKVRTPRGYTRAFRRRASALETFDGGFDGGVTRFWDGEVQGRMLVGVGTASVRETGISLLRTWGLPFIPGSALKGLAAATARQRGGETWAPTGEAHRALFGDLQAGGCVVFHDAWWAPGDDGEKLPLELDVMTVHHRDYYGGKDDAPCDWDEPTPVAFVTAKGTYLVALSGPSAWIDAAAELLTAGLIELGVGAKTAAGYGRVKLELKLSEEQKAEALVKKAADEERAKQAQALEAQRAALEEERARQARALAEEAEKTAAALRAKGGLLRDRVLAFRGPTDASSAGLLARGLLDAVPAGIEASMVHELVALLRKRHPDFWKGWLKNPKRTAEERALFGQ